MPSSADASFRRALTDVNNLMVFHENEGGNAPGRRSADLGSLNKSAIVLLCAAWESYVEFVIRECAVRNIDAAMAPSDMLKPLRKLVSSHLRSDKDESTWERTAGEGWRDLTKSCVHSIVSILNTPKTVQVFSLMKEVLGVSDLDGTWSWHKNPLGKPARRLNAFVALRGSIAHGEVLPNNVKKKQVTEAKDLLSRLVEKVETRLIADGLLA